MKAAYIIVIMAAILLVLGTAFFMEKNRPISPANDSGTAPKIHGVEISGFAFSPASLEIRTGDTVIWTNRDSAMHTIVSDTGGMFLSSAIAAGETFEYTFSTQGDYSYHCGAHPSMKGKIIVK